MRIYLAARYSRITELQQYRTDLEALGHTVTSRWVNGNHRIEDEDLSSESGREKRERFALDDWEDLLAADMVINFTEQPRSSTSRGDRHVELGIAIGLAKKIVIVGPAENVFHCLPGLAVVEEWSQALASIKFWLSPFPFTEEEAHHGVTGE